MGEPLRILKTEVAEEDGLDDIFEAQIEPVEQGVHHSEITVVASFQQGGGMSLKAACHHYKIASSTLRKKIKSGDIPAEKVMGVNGPEWRVYPKPTKFQGSNQQGAEQGVQQGAVPLQTGSHGIPNVELNRLLNIIESQAAKLEAASGQIGYLQAQLEVSTKLLTDKQQKPSWWHEFTKWFIGGT